MAERTAAGFSVDRGAAREHAGSSCVLGADRAYARALRFFQCGCIGAWSTRSQDPPDAALVRHLEEWADALRAGVDQDRSWALSADDPGRRRANGRTFCQLAQQP